MAREIERKFLLKDDSWREQAVGTWYRQGYMSSKSGVTVRVRVAGDQGYLTIKGLAQGISRLEFEYEIPVTEAEIMLDSLCHQPLIEKTRYKLNYGGLVWEIDEFEGENKGLILAEVELQDVNQQIELPDWIGMEVSCDPRYFNSNLARYPFPTWQ